VQFGHDRLKYHDRRDLKASGSKELRIAARVGVPSYLAHQSCCRISFLVHAGMHTHTHKQREREREQSQTNEEKCDDRTRNPPPSPMPAGWQLQPDQESYPGRGTGQRTGRQPREHSTALCSTLRAPQLHRHTAETQCRSQRLERRREDCAGDEILQKSARPHSCVVRQNPPLVLCTIHTDRWTQTYEASKHVVTCLGIQSRIALSLNGWASLSLSTDSTGRPPMEQLPPAICCCGVAQSSVFAIETG
jgi:hypothetical protein